MPRLSQAVFRYSNQRQNTGPTTYRRSVSRVNYGPSMYAVYQRLLPGSRLPTTLCLEFAQILSELIFPRRWH